DRAVADGAGVAERDVDEVLDLLRRRAAPIGPQVDDALGPLDVVEQVAQALDEPTAAGVEVFAVDDLVADVELAEVVEDFFLVPVRLGLEPLPRGLLALLRLLAPARLEAELPGLREELVPVAEEPVHRGEGGDDLARQLGFLLLRELLLVDVHDLLDGDVGALELLAQLAETLEGEVGREDRDGDLVLALLDPLGERDLALAREERHPTHLAEVEPDRVLGAPDGARREVDRLGGPVVVGLLGGLLLALAADLGGEPTRLGGVDDLDVHGAEHHHDVVELVERDDVGRQGVVDFVVGQEAFLLPDRDEAIELLELLLFTPAPLAPLGPWRPVSSGWATAPLIPSAVSPPRARGRGVSGRLSAAAAPLQRAGSAPRFALSRPGDKESRPLLSRQPSRAAAKRARRRCPARGGRSRPRRRGSHGRGCSGE